MFCYTKNEIKTIRGKVLFLGDSITNIGQYISFLNTYFKISHTNPDIELINAGVSGETVSGLSEPDHPFERPCVHKRIERAMQMVKPDWVILSYGINDGIYYPMNKDHFDSFKNGYLTLIETIKQYNSKIIVMTPMPFDPLSFQGELAELTEDNFSYSKPYKNYTQVMEQYAKWITESLSEYVDKTVDLYTPLSNDINQMRTADANYLSGDGIHPNLHGHLVIAQTILREVFHIHTDIFSDFMEKNQYSLFDMIYKRDSLYHNHIIEWIGHDNPYKSELLEKDILQKELEKMDLEIVEYLMQNKGLFNDIDDYNGFEKHTFFFEGYTAIVVFPKTECENRLWVYRTEFFGAFDEADISMLEKGYFLFFLNLSDQYGSLQCVETMERFRNYMVAQYHLSEKGILFGFSRGGLYALAYASKYPNYILAMYLDAPVVDIRSWPGRYLEGVSSREEWEDCLLSYGLSEETFQTFSKILDETKRQLIKSRIPMILVAGDSDNVVPYSDNGKILVDLYKQNEIAHLLILKEGIGHHPHSLQNPERIVSFLLQESAF